MLSVNSGNADALRRLPQAAGEIDLGTVVPRVRSGEAEHVAAVEPFGELARVEPCLLYTSDAADEAR
ncbi:MAG: hypothetical protein KUG77_28815, partial [Nannocystaceae bacterium]|nr:hypothetical protein [Nannocystaceae bacterium]